MKTRSIAPLLLAALLLIPLVSACGGGTEPAAAGTAAAQTGAAAPENEAEAIETEAEALPDPGIEAVDLGGAEYTVLNRQKTDFYVYQYHEFMSDGENGETINDAVYQRNMKIEEKYNLKLVSVETDDYVGAAQKSVKAGDNAYQLIFPMHNSAFTLAQGGLLYDMSAIPHVDIGDVWWMDNISRNTSVGGKNYFVTGALNLSTLNGVGAIYFNKSLAEQMNITDLYDTVKGGGWTIDRFAEYCRGITRDVNGDGVMNGEDAFGLTCNGFVWQPLYAGSDSILVGKDADDMPSCMWNSAKNTGIISRLVTFLNDHESVILVNQFPELQDADGWGNASVRMFTEDRALFWIEIIYGVSTLRNMDKDFGILPIPKYSETQSDYTSYIHSGHTSTSCVPVTNPDPDLAGRVLEDAAYWSYLILKPAYYDTTLKGKISRDNESGEMLDIIYSKINLDLALLIPDMPIDGAMREIMIKNNTEFVSTIEKQMSKCDKTVEKFVQKLTDLG